MTRLERAVEEKFVRLVCDFPGVEVLKMTPEGQVGWPDRLVLLPGGRCCWVELKRPGGKARKIQQHRHKRLKELGHDVGVFDDAWDAAYFVGHAYRRAVRVRTKDQSKRSVWEVLPAKPTPPKTTA